MSLRVRRCYDTDLLHQLDSTIFPEDQPIAPQRDMWWVASWDGTPCGFAGLSYVGELIRAGVLKRYRNHGIQKRLIQVRLMEARRQGLQSVDTYTSEDNVKSMRNLARAGFLPTQLEDGFLYWSRDI